MKDLQYSMGISIWLKTQVQMPSCHTRLITRVARNVTQTLVPEWPEPWKPFSSLSRLAGLAVMTGQGPPERAHWIPEVFS